MNKCDKCGFLHYRTDPCRKPKKSTAPLKEVDTHGVQQAKADDVSGRRPKEASSPRRKGITEGPKAKGYGLRVAEPPALVSHGEAVAGTQALPVDTNSRHDLKASRSSGPADVPKSNGKQRAQVTAGETAPKFDRKAWMREYQRNYMRNVYRPKLKASKSNPNTPERNDE